MKTAGWWALVSLAIAVGLGDGKTSAQAPGAAAPPGASPSQLGGAAPLTSNYFNLVKPRTPRSHLAHVDHPRPPVLRASPAQNQVRMYSPNGVGFGTHSQFFDQFANQRVIRISRKR